MRSERIETKQRRKKLSSRFKKLSAAGFEFRQACAVSGSRRSKDGKKLSSRFKKLSAAGFQKYLKGTLFMGQSTSDHSIHVSFLLSKMMSRWSRKFQISEGFPSQSIECNFHSEIVFFFFLDGDVERLRQIPS